MSRLLCCRRARQADMGAALSHPQEGEACDGAGVPAAPPTMADVIRERKKKAGGAGLGTLRRRIAAAARRPRDSRPDRGCEHARFIRSVVSSWRLAEVFLLCEELEAGAALRDLVTQAELAREPAAALHADLAAAHRDRRWCDVELGGAGWALGAHRAVLAARCQYFRDLLQRYPNCSRVPLEGAGAALSRDEAAAVLRALYGGGHAPHAPHAPHTPHAQRTRADHAHKWERGADPEADLDIINDNSSACTCASRGACGAGAGAAGGGEAALVRRLGALLGFSPDTLQQDMRYLLESGEYADARLVFGAEAGCGAGAAYGFRGGLELPAHRVLLAARSRYLRELLARRPRAPPPHAHPHQPHAPHPAALVCLDENVLPRRFARALLHAAYTDQVDLSLVGRCSSSPCSTGSGSGGTMAWAGVSRGGGSRGASTALLDDAFQLYEIARFLEMPIVVQGCEDAIVEALCADTLPHVLRWAAAPHASQWVHRQAMRYLRDEFPAVMAASSSSRLPRAALAQALASPFLQASEAQALRALLRWAPGRPGGGGGGGGAGDEAAERELASLVALVRTEHLPPEHELLAQAARRGLLPAGGGGGGEADAWLGRGAARGARCFAPHLEELRALLQHQPVPEAEVSLVRRQRCLHRIPDTLYMVAAERAGGGAAADGAPPEPGAAACVSPRAMRALRHRLRELRAAPPAQRALALPSSERAPVYRQLALRAVRERSLPDACADLLLADADSDTDAHDDRQRDGAGSEAAWGSPEEEAERREPAWNERPDCCRLQCAGSLRCGTPAGRGGAGHAHGHELPRGGACRREQTPSRQDALAHRSCATGGGGGGGGGGAAGSGGRLSAAVPDVAMAPNANTHLLSHADYFRHAAPWEYSGAGAAGGGGASAGAGGVGGGGGGGVLQLDLGDGATHTPRPGSRAQRAAQAQRGRDLQVPAGMAVGVGAGPGARSADEDELLAAIERSVLRAYSSSAPLGRSPAPPSPPPPRAARAPRAPRATLPPSYRSELAPAPAPAPAPPPTLAANSQGASGMAVVTPSHRRYDFRSGAGAGGGGGAGARRYSLHRLRQRAEPERDVRRDRDLDRYSGGAEGYGGGAGGGAGGRGSPAGYA